MKNLVLLLLVSAALAAPKQESSPPERSPPPSDVEESTQPIREKEGEEEGITESPSASAAGGKGKSPLGDQTSLDELAQDFEALQESGNLPVAVGADSPQTEEKFGTKVNIFGVEVPVIILAKLGLAIVSAAASAIGGGGTAAAAAALGEGVSFPAASDPAAVARILKETTDTATAVFGGNVVGEVFFAQARRAEGTPAATVITAKFSGVPPGMYQLEVREKGTIDDDCANLGPRYSSDKLDEEPDILGNLTADEGGQASAILSTSGAHLTGSKSILGRSIVLVSAESSGAPLACAVIVRQ